MEEFEKEWCKYEIKEHDHFIYKNIAIHFWKAATEAERRRIQEEVDIIPRRREPLGGQVYSYVRVEEVNLAISARGDDE